MHRVWQRDGKRKLRAVGMALGAASTLLCGCTHAKRGSRRGGCCACVRACVQRPNAGQAPGIRTVRPVPVHGPEQRLVLRDVLFKRKAVVLVGLFEPRLAAGARHARHVDAQRAALLFLRVGHGA